MKIPLAMAIRIFLALRIQGSDFVRCNGRIACSVCAVTEYRGNWLARIGKLDMERVLKITVFFCCCLPTSLMAQRYPITNQGEFVPRDPVPVQSRQSIIRVNPGGFPGGFPGSGNIGNTPRNSTWATSQPATMDQPGYAKAFAPTGFPDRMNSDLEDVSMSPDDWGASGQQALPKNDLNRKAFVRNFPGENLNQNTNQGRSKFLVEDSGNQTFRPASRGELKEREGELPELPSVENSNRIPESNQKDAQLEFPKWTPGQPLPRVPSNPDGPMLDQVPVPTTVQTDAFPSFELPGASPTAASPSITPASQNPSQSWVYRPDLGHRSADIQFRPAYQPDAGEKFDFENKKREYPPFKEILATGRYFVSADVNLLKPYFQNNNAIASTLAGATTAGTFDFGYSVAPGFKAGFESKYGPGLEITYFQADQDSRPFRFDATGAATGSIQAILPEGGAFSRLSASNAGETLSASHGLDVQLIGVAFFKEIKFPIARLNGIYGFHHASINQEMQATLSNGGGVLGTLVSRSDMKAFGPRVAFEYYRPIGHTKLTLVAKFGGSLLLGNRDHFVSNSLTGESSRIGADELLTMFDFGTSVMYKRFFGENRFFYARFGYDTQNWLGGGNATEPQSDFGFRGVVFTLGVNR